MTAVIRKSIMSIALPWLKIDGLAGERMGAVREKLDLAVGHEGMADLRREFGVAGKAHQNWVIVHLRLTGQI